MTYLTLIPAYGRDYKSKKEVIADFEANKDFVIADVMNRFDGKPVNREQLLPGPITLNIRFKKLASIAQVILREEN